MLTKGSIAVRLRANFSPNSNDLYIFGKLNRPRCASQDAFCFFWSKSSNFTSPEYRCQKQRNLLLWPGQTMFESHRWHFVCFLLLFGVQGIMYSFSFSVSEKSGKIEVQKWKISRLSVLLCRPRNGPLRPVCGHTNHRTTIIHTILKSPTDLDVHCRKWPRRSGHSKQQNLRFATELFTLQLVFYIYLICLHFVGTRGIT